MSDKQMKYRYEDGEIENKHRSEKSGKRTKKKKKSKVKRVIFTFFIVFLMAFAMAFGVAVGYAYNMLTEIEQDESFNKNEIEINEGVKTTGYRNILLYGVDARNQKNSYDGSLSDVIMIVSINQDTKKVRIASVYRDTYLQNPKNKTFDKITHAFGEGGPSLSMSIINTNLDLDITDYVAVNFNVVVDAVDAVGGVTIDITSEEAGYINQYIDEVNKTTGHKSKHITKGGTYTLDGVQATAYSRIRYTAGGDWKRTERQRKVLDLVFEKAKKMSIGELTSLANTVLGKVSTNLSKTEILYLISQAASYEIEESKGWPFEVADYQPNGVWYGVPKNLEKQVTSLHEFLFDKEDYVPSTSVKSISDAMIKRTGIK
ncbi:MAG: LCP family protein [Clostridia bacterium]|nr:LCP family protein [Clostridia bacterium]